MMKVLSRVPRDLFGPLAIDPADPSAVVESRSSCRPNRFAAVTQARRLLLMQPIDQRLWDNWKHAIRARTRLTGIDSETTPGTTHFAMTDDGGDG